MAIKSVRDLNEAERWYRRSLDMRNERDRPGRGKCYNQLGALALERFKEAKGFGEPDATLHAHIGAALAAYHEAFKLIPEDEVNDCAVAHHMLGAAYTVAGDNE